MSALAGQESRGIIDSLGIEEAMLHVSHTGGGQFLDERFLAFSEHVGVGVLHDEVQIGVDPFPVSDQVMSQEEAEKQRLTRDINDGPFESRPVEPVLEQVVKIGVHLPQARYSLREPPSLLRISLVELKDANAMSGDEGVEVLVRLVRVGLETHIAISSRLEYLIKRVVDDGPELLILLNQREEGL